MSHFGTYGTSESPFSVGESVSKIDMHLHTIASGKAGNWWVKELGFGAEANESYTQPVDALRKARAAGMDFVTITDHETINGVMTMTQHPEILVGEEINTVFPEDRTMIDILVYGLSREDHVELQRRRPNAHDVVAYLREAGLVYVLAHPLFEMGKPLTRAAIERRMAMFPLWEFINGSRPLLQNSLARRLAESVDGADIRHMARKHGLPEPSHVHIAGTAGTDDHGGVYIGRTWTEIPHCTHVSDVLAALRAGETRTCGEHGSVAKMTASGLRIVAGALTAGTTTPSDVAAGFTNPVSSPLAAIKAQQPNIAKLLDYLPLIQTLDEQQLSDLLCATYESNMISALFGNSSEISLIGLISRAGKLVDAHSMVAPVLGLHGYFGRENTTARRQKEMLFPGKSEPIHAALVVDDLEGIHGVSTMYRHIAGQGPAANGDRVSLVTCGTDVGDGAIGIRPIAQLPIPMYGQHELGVPSLMDVLNHVAEARYDIIHISAPGPLGLAFLLAGATYGIPVVGMYHTELSKYAGVLSGDPMVEEVVEFAVKNFYNRCRAMIVPSRATADSLIERGYSAKRVEVLRNGVDTVRFNPARRSDEWRAQTANGKTLLLFVGRISKEKGLEDLANGFLSMRKHRGDVHLVIVGDGPYRAELSSRLGDSATFTGFLQGDELAMVYASCDIFVFPSMTDTLGRVVIEAQASGLPAVVFGTGGPRECVQPGTSGFVVEPGDYGHFMSRIETLVDRDAVRSAMSQSAVEFSSDKSWSAVRDALVSILHDIVDASVSGAVLPEGVQAKTHESATVGISAS